MVKAFSSLLSAPESGVKYSGPQCHATPPHFYLELQHVPFFFCKWLCLGQQEKLSRSRCHAQRSGTHSQLLVLASCKPGQAGCLGRHHLSRVKPSQSAFQRCITSLRDSSPGPQVFMDTELSRSQDLQSGL